MSSNSIRVSSELFRQAHAHGQIHSRSTAQQVEHWARLGVALEGLALSVEDVSELLRTRAGSVVETQAASAIWQYKRARQSEDLMALDAGVATPAQMAWIRGDIALQAVAVDSPL